jgi:hypothetical protein
LENFGFSSVNSGIFLFFKNPKFWLHENGEKENTGGTWISLQHPACVWSCHTVALPFTLKRILRQKNNYTNSNISLCKNIIFKKSSKRNQNPSRYYNSITNLKFQHKLIYHLSKILI